MSKITCIIVDDEANNRDMLAGMIFKFCPTVELVGQASGVKEAVELINEHKPDLVLLDVEMPDGNGFTLFETFKNPDFSVVFTTAHADYAIKAIKFAALDYLLKPVNITELREAVEKVSEKKENVNTKESLDKKLEVLSENNASGNFDFKRIALPTSEGLEFYEIADILRCEADRAYCRFFFKNGKKIIVSKPLAEYADLLEECNFYRVHKSNMVNTNHIKKYVSGRGGYVILSDDSHVDVSVRKKEGLMKALGRA